ncbi:MAG: zinc ABC transporter substrate-binding protein [Brevinematales bacterium]|nr:zinc ABC transporter substrate-binding protein [Brevinematales bacterium]
MSVNILLIMRFNNKIFIIFFLITPLFAEKPVIIVSILPQVEFVERIAKDRVTIQVLAGKGANPHNYEPTPTQLLAMNKAKIWLAIGIDFERALKPKVSSLYHNIKIVDITNGVKYRKLEEHNHNEENEHLPYDPHIWLGYEQVKIIIYNTFIVLKDISPENSKFFEKNYKEYIKEIDETFSYLIKKLSPLRGKTVFVYHPAFGYFFDNFGIIQRSFEVRGKEPTQKEIVRLIEEMRIKNAKVILVQKQFSKNAAKIIARSIGGKVIEIDHLEKDWLKNIKNIGELMSEVIN